MGLRDSVKRTNSAVFNLTLNRAGETPVSRTITVDYVTFDTSEDPKDNIGSFRALLLGKYNKFIQPNGWRDTDLAEDEWTITEVEARLVIKTETKFTFDEESQM